MRLHASFSRVVASSPSSNAMDGSTIQIVDLVRPPRQTCRWPTSGSVIRTDADGTVHTLTYGPACGQATLDGQDISLQRPPGGGGCGGMSPPTDGTGGTGGTGGTDPNTGLVLFR